MITKFSKLITIVTNLQLEREIDSKEYKKYIF